jgi:hypothetical protein
MNFNILERSYKLSSTHPCISGVDGAEFGCPPMTLQDEILAFAVGVVLDELSATNHVFNSLTTTRVVVLLAHFRRAIVFAHLGDCGSDVGAFFTFKLVGWHG